MNRIGVILLAAILATGLTTCQLKHEHSRAVNWLMSFRLDEGCEQLSYGLYAGPQLLVCDVEEAAWTVDSLWVVTTDTCYAFALQTYRGGAVPPPRACRELEAFIHGGGTRWVAPE